MNVICPKCQSENQVNPSAQGVIRVVCARCATIFEAKFNQETAKGNLGQPLMPPLAASASTTPGTPGTTGTPGRDAYATRIEPDFDEVLDIPLAGSADYQTSEPASDFEDVFTTTGENISPPVSVPAPPPPPELRVTALEPPLSDPRVTVPLSRHTPEPEFEPLAEDQFNTSFEPPAENQFNTPFDPPFDTQFNSRYDTQSEPQDAFGMTESEQNGHMPPALLTSWPVLPGDEEKASAAPQTSGSRSKAGRVFMRVALMAIVFGGLGFVALYFLRDKLPGGQSSNNTATNRPAANNQNTSGSGTASAPGSGAANETKPVAAPNAAESKPAGASETKPADKGQEVAKKTGPEAAKKDAAGAAATSPSKTAPPETAKPPAENKSQNAVKPAPLDVPFGHSVKPGEGSFTVQVASFNDQAQANERAASLKSAGIEARVVKVDIPGKGTWHRLQLGRFTTRAEAVRYGNQLKARGLVKDAFPTAYQGR